MLARTHRVVGYGVVAWFLLTSCGHKGASGATNPPASTAAGTPIGIPSTASIGPLGGSLSGPDGTRISVTIPADALSSPIDVSIQPITNNAPGGLGNAYRLQPDGQTFSKPVTITFQYTNGDLAATAASALDVAYQTSRGYWAAYKQVSLDTTSQTVTIQSTHFSDWGLLATAYLKPTAALVRTGQRLTLEVWNCGPASGGTGPDGFTLFMSVCGQSNLAVDNWSVNGLAGGNANTGTILATGNQTATFTAPAVPPAPSTVAASVEVTVMALEGATAPKVLLVSNLTIDDCGAGGRPCTWTGTASTTTSAQATVTWTFDHQIGDSLVFTPSGTVTLASQAFGSYCSASPLTDSISPSDGQLVIDYSHSPPDYSGGATTSWVLDITCNGVTQPVTEPVTWFQGSGSVTNDVTYIQGGTAAGTWSFARVP